MLILQVFKTPIEQQTSNQKQPEYEIKKYSIKELVKICSNIGVYLLNSLKKLNIEEYVFDQNTNLKKDGQSEPDKICLNLQRILKENGIDIKELKIKYQKEKIEINLKIDNPSIWVFAKLAVSGIFEKSQIEKIAQEELTKAHLKIGETSYKKIYGGYDLSATLKPKD
jgi:hypothetical protein